MGLTRTYIGDHPTTGEPRWHYASDDATKPVVLTGPSSGAVTLPDGTVYNVSEDVIEVASLDHAHQVSHEIGLQHEMTGRFDAVHPETGDPVPFRHSCPVCEK